jgi:uncharacterized protein YjdB
MPAQVNHMQHLQNSYYDATRKGGLIDFTRQVRTEKKDLSGKYTINQDNLANLFSKTVWHTIKTRNGHRKLENIVTGIVVEYRNHDNKGGIDPGAAETIFYQVQEHLNILCNQIYNYTNNNWTYQPDYPASVKRFVEYLKMV